MKALLLRIFLQGSLSDHPFVTKILGNKAKTMTCKECETAHMIRFSVVNLVVDVPK